MYGPSDSYYEFDPHFFAPDDEYDEDAEVYDDYDEYAESLYDDFERDYEAEWGGEDKSDWWMAGA